MTVISDEPQRVDLRGVKIYPFTQAGDLIDFADSRKGILVAINAEKILNANPDTLEIINSNIAYCDGEWAAKAARQKGARVEKIAGCELWLKIVERFHRTHTFYIIGATPQVNSETTQRLRRDFPDIKIVGARDGYLRTPAERQALIDDVAEKAPDVVFVAMGSPTQELLMRDMLARHRAIYQGLGGSFDVYTGKVARAPKWWIDHHLEAAYRLIRQPKRIKRNYKYITFLWWLATRQF